MKEIGIILFFIGAVGLLTMVGRWMFMLDPIIGILYIFLLMFFIGWILITIDF